MKVFRKRQMTARGKGIVGIAARRGPFFSLTSTTTPPPTVGHPAMALAPKLSSTLTRPCSVPLSFCAICLSSPHPFCHLCLKNRNSCWESAELIWNKIQQKAKYTLWWGIASTHNYLSIQQFGLGSQSLCLLPSQMSSNLSRDRCAFLKIFRSKENEKRSIGPQNCLWEAEINFKKSSQTCEVLSQIRHKRRQNFTLILLKCFSLKSL